MRYQPISNIFLTQSNSQELVDTAKACHAIGALPIVALLAFGGLVWARGVANGVLPALLELLLAVVVAVLALASAGRRGGRARSRGGRKGLKER